MKKITILFSFLLGFAGCQPDEFPAIGKRQEVVPQFAGTWSLTSVVQTDNDAVRKGFPAYAQRQDITNDFPYKDFKLTLTVDNQDLPATFTIDAGDSPNIIGNISAGTWSVDNQKFPSKMTFGDNISSIELGTFAGLSNGALVFKLIRTQPKGGTQESVVTYQYTFSKEEN